MAAAEVFVTPQPFHYPTNQSKTYDFIESFWLRYLGGLKSLGHWWLLKYFNIMCFSWDIENCVETEELELIVPMWQLSGGDLRFFIYRKIINSTESLDSVFPQVPETEFKRVLSLGAEYLSGLHIPALPIISYVALGKLHNISMISFRHFQKGLPFTTWK